MGGGDISTVSHMLFEFCRLRSVIIIGLVEVALLTNSIYLVQVRSYVQEPLRSFVSVHIPYGGRGFAPAHTGIYYGDGIHA